MWGLPGGCPSRSRRGKSFVPQVAFAQQGCDQWMSQSNSVSKAFQGNMQCMQLDSVGCSGIYRGKLLMP